jgi:hypothetical protein
LQRWEYLWLNGISLGLIIWTSLHGFSRLLCGAVAGVFIPKYVGQVFVATGISLGVRVLLGIAAFGIFLAVARFFLPPSTGANKGWPKTKVLAVNLCDTPSFFPGF